MTISWLENGKGKYIRFAHLYRQYKYGGGLLTRQLVRLSPTLDALKYLLAIMLKNQHRLSSETRLCNFWMKINPNIFTLAAYMNPHVTETSTRQNRVASISS